MVHYYHIFCGDEWRRIVDEHFEALHASGLIEHLEAIRVGIVGAPKARDEVAGYLGRMGLDIEVVAEACDGWEQTTHIPLWHEAKTGVDATVLYAHTKGVAYPSARSEAWRRGMTQHLILGWRKAVSLLDQADVVGAHRIDDHRWPHEVPHWAGISPTRRIAEQLHRESEGAYPFDPDDPQWADEPKPLHTVVHFSGNFWWTTMNWIRQLPMPLCNTRFDAETWIGCIKPPRLVDLQPGSPFSVYTNKETQA